MDIGTLAGIIVGLGLIAGSMMLTGSLGRYVDIPSLMIVMGGTIASTLITHPLNRVTGVMSVLKIAFVRHLPKAEETIALLVRFAEKARREGLLSMEEEASHLDDEFLKRGIQLVVDGTDPELVRNILDIELSFLEERHKTGQGLFETMGTYAPAFGMIGTLIGLIQMLSELDNPDAVGPGLATALITTFYGVILANLIFLPIAGKLKARSEEEILIKEVMIEGILSIQAGENPRIVEEKLKAFLPPNSRVAVDNHSVNAAERTEGAEGLERPVTENAR